MILFEMKLFKLAHIQLIKKIKKDEYPLASLPLLGYTITIPTESDNINKDFVFKLQFKNHVYFFRAESQYSFDRYKLF